MKFLADINIPKGIINFLRQKNHDVLDIKKIGLNTTDIEIIKVALKKKRIILTHDKDFQVLSKFPKYQAGIIFIRLKIQNVEHLSRELQELITTKTEQTLLNSITTINEDSTTSDSY